MRFLFFTASAIALTVFGSPSGLNQATADHVDFIRNDSKLSDATVVGFSMGGGEVPALDPRWHSEPYNRIRLA